MRIKRAFVNHKFSSNKIAALSKLSFLVVASFVFLFALSVSSVAFDFTGVTHFSNATNMSGVNVTMSVYNFTDEGPELLPGETLSELSGSDGSFNLSDVAEAEGDDEYLYKPVLIKFNGNGYDADYISKPLPQFDEEVFLELGSTDFYLKEAATINVTAYNLTGGVKPFQYMFKDTNLGYTIYEDHQNYVNDKLFYVPADRNYSFLLYFNQTMPLQHEIDNLSDYSVPKHLDLSFNVSDEFMWLSGYAFIEGSEGDNPDFDELQFVGFILEPGNVISSHTSLPYNMSQWRGPGNSDQFDPETGYYNITLVHPGVDLDIMLLFLSWNDSLADYYMAYQNITIGPGSGDQDDFNVSLYEPGGDSEVGFLYNYQSGDYDVWAPAVNFSVQNLTGSAVEEAFIITTLDYETELGMEFKWVSPLTGSDDTLGMFQLPLASDDDISKMKIFAMEYAPMKQAIDSSEFDFEPVVINLTDFEPGEIPGGDDIPDIFIDMIKSTAECNVPHYDRAACSLIPQTKNLSEFDPFSIILGGADLSFVMGRTANNITIIYKNTDLLASGPPDVLFDGNATSGEGLEELWRFGSKGPEIYDEVLIGIPYSSGLDPNTVNVSLPLLYDNDWNVVWNTTQNGTSGVGGNLTDYADYTESWFSGIQCSTTDNTADCYINSTTGFVWLTIPHFSGVGPAVSGNGTSVGDVNFTVTKTALNSTYEMNDIVEYVINITNDGDTNISLVSVNDTYNATVLVYTSASRQNTSNGADWVYFYNVTQGALIEPNADFLLYVNMTAQVLGTNVNNTAEVNATDTNDASGTATASVFVNVSDMTAPSVFDLVPGSGSNFNVSDVIEIAANVTDNINVSQVFANVTYPNNTVLELELANAGGDKYNNSFTVPNLIDQFNVTFIANDSSNNFNTSETTFFVGNDVVTPAVDFIGPTPDDATNQTSATATINVTVTDDVEVEACVLDLDGTNETMTVVGSGVSVSCNFANTSLSEGTHTYAVYVNDTSGNMNYTETRTFIVDINSPDVQTIVSPTDSQNYTTGETIVFNATISKGAGTDIETVIFQVTNGSDPTFNLTSTAENATQFSSSIAVSGMNDGDHTFTVYANDTVGNMNDSETRTFSVDTVEPAFGYNATSTTSATAGSAVWIYANWTDTTDMKNATLIVDGTVNQTNTTLGGLDYVNFSYTTTQADTGQTLNFTITVTDTVGLSNTTDIMQVSVTDGVAPSLALVSPVDTLNTTSTSITFQFNVSDNAATTVNCNLTIDGVVNTTVNSTSITTSYSTLSTQVAGFTNGSYQWNVTCWDTLDNINESTTRTLTVDTVLPYFNPVPSDQEVNYSEAFGYQINGADTVGVSAYSVSDTTNFAINNSGYLSNNTLLSVGTYELTITVNDTSNNQNSTTFNVTVKLNVTSNVIANTSTDIDLSPADANITLYLADNVTTTITVTKETPNTTGATASLNALKAIDIDVDSSTEGNLTWALIKIFYNTTELTAANIQESSLKIYYYNETNGSWQLEPTQGVDTTNDYVWANITHFSLFGAFGTAPPAAAAEEEEEEGTTTGRSNYAAITSKTLEGVSKTHIWASVYPDHTLVMAVISQDIAVTKVIFDATSEAKMTKMIVTHLYEKPSEVPSIGKDYGYLSLESENMPTFENAKIRFKVPESWLTDNGFEADDVVLYRYSDGRWNALGTERIAGDGGNYFYEASTPGFSYFAISTKAEVEEVPAEEEGVPGVEEAPVVEEEVPPTEEIVSEEEKPLYWRWIAAVMIVLAVVVGTIILGHEKKKPKGGLGTAHK